MTESILVIGACGQLGTEITEALRQYYKPSQVIAADVIIPPASLKDAGPFESLDILNVNRVSEILEKYKVTQIYQLAAILSARGEQNPNLAWNINIQGNMNVLDMAVKTGRVKKVYFPSSIAVFGPHTPQENTPQYTTTDPTTVYGITKLVGELLCDYYWRRYELDVRCLRYPGLISYKTLPGGGTTDYAIDIFYQIAKTGHYNCFLREDTYLPMMYMPDALKATFQLMEAPLEAIKVRTGYNMGAFSFSPKEIFEAIKKEIPEATISYEPDFRQQIADSWPNSVDFSLATQDWGWQPDYTLESMTLDMLRNIPLSV